METISLDQLDNVTGGAGIGDVWNTVRNSVGGLLGGSGINIGAQIGNNQRSAQGNSAPVSLGDNSGITIQK